VAIRGRRRSNRWRMNESGLVSDPKRLPRDEWIVNGGRSRWIRNPREALRMAEVIVITKSGAARVRGQRMPRPPRRMLI
jgi:hypothetical protein